MSERLDEHQEAIAHQAVMEKLWTAPVLDAALGRLEIAPSATSVLVAEARCGYAPQRWSGQLGEATRIIALDPSRAMLDQARARIDEDLQRRLFFVPQQVNALSYAADVFAGALCVHGLNSATQLRDGLKELARVTQRGGRLMIASPAARCFPELEDLLHEALRAARLDDAAARLIEQRELLVRESSLVVLARELGLHDLDVQHVSWHVSFATGREAVYSPLIRETLMTHWLSVIRSGEREPVLRYLSDAIDTYFYGRQFTCTLHALTLIATR